jgi:hypothetical protein
VCMKKTYVGYDFGLFNRKNQHNFRVTNEGIPHNSQLKIHIKLYLDSCQVKKCINLPPGPTQNRRSSERIAEFTFFKKLPERYHRKRALENLQLTMSFWEFGLNLDSHFKSDVVLTTVKVSNVSFFIRLQSRTNGPS